MKRMLPLTLLTGLLAMFLVPSLAVAYRTGPPAGHTGAPQVGGRTCVLCHIGGGPNTGPGKVTIVAPGTTYAPGSVIPVTVSLGGTLQNVNRNGYQMAAYTTGNNSALAGWTPDSAHSQVLQDHVEHILAGTTRTSWISYFKTPAAPVSAFTLYAASNDANDNNFPTGDRIYTTNLPLTAGTVNLSMRSVPFTGTNVALDLNAPGDANKAYVLAASFSNLGIPIGSRVIPLFPDSLFVLTVTNAIPTVFQNYTGILDGSGRATATLVLLPFPALKGVILHHAFLVIDPTKPFSIGTISNGLPVVIF